jgi:hypothetical protein
MNYYSLRITSTLFLYIHITVYTADSMSVSSLSTGPTTTHYMMLFFYHPKAGVMYLYLYISHFYDLEVLNVPKSL